MHHWRATLLNFFNPVRLATTDLRQQTQFLQFFLLVLGGIGGSIVLMLTLFQGLSVGLVIGGGELLLIAVLRAQLTPHTYRRVGLVLCLGLVTGISVILSVSPSLNGPSIMVYFVALLCASQLVDTRWVLLISGVSIAALVWLYTHPPAAPPAVYAPLRLYTALAIAGQLGICTVLAAMGTYSLFQLYQRLQTQRDLLAQRVTERAAELMAANHALREAQATLAQQVQERTAHLEAEMAQHSAAAAALRQSEAHYRQLIELIPQAIMLRRGTHYVFANPAALTLVGVPDLATLQRLGPADFVLPEQQALLQTRQRHLQQPAAHLPLQEYRIRTFDGRLLDTEVTSQVVQFEGQTTTLTVCTDITTRKQTEHAQRAQEAAEAANHAKSAFLANMSHELRTPLSAILGYAELLLESAPPLSKTEARAAKVLAAAQHLLALINEVLDFSKIEAGKLELHYETFPLPWLVEATLLPLQPLLAKSQNQLQVTLAPNLGLLTADPHWVQQILFNLLHNAAKFTHHGHITLTLAHAQRAGQAGVAFTVADTGTGIAPEYLEKIFQPFQQAVAALRTEGGTGLGLAISRLLCQMHGGEIEVQSTLGQGSVFTVWLPLVPAAKP